MVPESHTDILEARPLIIYLTRLTEIALHIVAELASVVGISPMSLDFTRRTEIQPVGLCNSLYIRVQAPASYVQYVCSIPSSEYEILDRYTEVHDLFVQRDEQNCLLNS